MRYPLDFEDLNKGDVLERERLIDILGRKPEGRFKLAALGLARLIEDEVDCTCKAEHSGTTGELLRLRLLTDSEAAKYNPKLCDQHLRGFKRRLHKAMRVDMENLTAQERKQLEAQLVVKSRQYQAIRAARRRAVGGNGLSLPGGQEGAA